MDMLQGLTLAEEALAEQAFAEQPRVAKSDSDSDSDSNSKGWQDQGQWEDADPSDQLRPSEEKQKSTKADIAVQPEAQTQPQAQPQAQAKDFHTSSYPLLTCTVILCQAESDVSLKHLLQPGEFAICKRKPISQWLDQPLDALVDTSNAVCYSAKALPAESSLNSLGVCAAPRKENANDDEAVFDVPTFPCTISFDAFVQREPTAIPAVAKGRQTRYWWTWSDPGRIKIYLQELKTMENKRFMDPHTLIVCMTTNVMRALTAPSQVNEAKEALKWIKEWIIDPSVVENLFDPFPAMMNLWPSKLLDNLPKHWEYETWENAIVPMRWSTDKQRNGRLQHLVSDTDEKASVSKTVGKTVTATEPSKAVGTETETEMETSTFPDVAKTDLDIDLVQMVEKLVLPIPHRTEVKDANSNANSTPVDQILQPWPLSYYLKLCLAAARNRLGHSHSHSHVNEQKQCHDEKHQDQPENPGCPMAASKAEKDK